MRITNPWRSPIWVGVIRNNVAGYFNNPESLGEEQKKLDDEYEIRSSFSLPCHLILTGNLAVAVVVEGAAFLVA